MFQDRALGLAETALRTASGASNLAAALGEWAEAGPEAPEETWTVSALDVTIAGPGLLASLADFGGEPGVLEIDFAVDDGFGTTRDLAAVTLHSTSSLREWSAGRHEGTIADPAAVSWDDGSSRPGLRGHAGGLPGAQARWTGPEIPLGGLTRVRGAVWEVHAPRDASGRPVAVGKIVLRVGRETPAGVDWFEEPLFDDPDSLLRGWRDFDPPLPDGDRIQWTAALDYPQPGEAVPDGGSPTLALFTLGAWVALPTPWWHLRSVAELIRRADTPREFMAAGWGAGDDLALLRIPLDVDLRGRHRERLRARFAAPATALTHLELQPIADLGFDEED